MSQWIQKHRRTEALSKKESACGVELRGQCARNRKKMDRGANEAARRVTLDRHFVFFLSAKWFFYSTTEERL